MKFKNIFKCEVIRNGEVVHSSEDHNLITTAGANLMLDIMFDGATQVPSSGWFVGLISGNSPAVNVANTMLTASRSWSEFTDYSEATRESYTTDDPSSGAISNGTTLAEFTIDTAGTIGGGFLCTDSAKAGTGGVMFSASSYASSYAVAIGDIYRVAYTIQLVAP